MNNLVSEIIAKLPRFANDIERHEIPQVRRYANGMDRSERAIRMGKDIARMTGLGFPSSLNYEEN